MESIRQGRASTLADDLGLSRGRSMISQLSRSIKSKSRETNFQSNTAAELWINIAGKDFRLVGKTIRIGRASDNDIVLDHKSCSRYHAVLTIHGDQIVIEDLKSRNGIGVNGAPVKRAELKDNDEIRVGDLEGVYFQRLKNSPKNAAHSGSKFNAILQKFVPAQALDSFNQLSAKRKKILVVAAVILLAGFWMMLSKSQMAQMNAPAQAAAISKAELKPSDKRFFERCLEAEDLGNFRQARACLQNLSQTSDVLSALDRVQKRQAEFSELRYKEGMQAFDNYYYDIAMQKWQEVLLVSDDSSEYRLQAMAGIQKAEEKKKQR